MDSWEEFVLKLLVVRHKTSISKPLLLSMGFCSDPDSLDEQVATFLTQLHTMDLLPAHTCGILVQDYAKQYSGLLLRAQAELYPDLDELEQLFIKQVIGNYLESGDALAFHPALLHGDLSPDHVLFDEGLGSVTAIIDFGDMMIGDPAWDVVFLYEDYGLDFLSRLALGNRA